MPGLPIGQHHLEVVKLQFGVGSELLLRITFPIHIAESVAGKLHAAQIDELL